ncbi:uncharacterized protein LOC143934809 [Lithobates pipiens]
MARLSTAIRHTVVILHQQDLSHVKTSKQTVYSRCAVQAVLKKHKVAVFFQNEFQDFGIFEDAVPFRLSQLKIPMTQITDLYMLYPMSTADTNMDQRNLEIHREPPPVTSTETANTETIRRPPRDPKIHMETTSATSTEMGRKRRLKMQRKTPSVTVTEEVPRMPLTTTERTHHSGIPASDPNVKIIAKKTGRWKKLDPHEIAGIIVAFSLLGMIILTATTCFAGILCCNHRTQVMEYLKKRFKR